MTRLPQVAPLVRALVSLLPPPRLAAVRPRVVQALALLGQLLAGDNLSGFVSMFVGIVDALAALQVLKTAWVACSPDTRPYFARGVGAEDVDDALRAQLAAARLGCLGEFLTLAQRYNRAAPSGFPRDTFEPNLELPLSDVDHVDGAHVGFLQVAQQLLLLMPQKIQFLRCSALASLWRHLCSHIGDVEVSHGRPFPCSFVVAAGSLPLPCVSGCCTPPCATRVREVGIRVGDAVGAGVVTTFHTARRAVGLPVSAWRREWAPHIPNHRVRRCCGPAVALRAGSSA